MSIENATILDLDALLDADMDAVETAPEYVTPSRGLYRLAVKEAGIASREKKDATTGATTKTNRLRVIYSIVATTQSEEPPFPNGSLFQEGWNADEKGLPYFKRQAMNILNVKSLEGAKLRDVFEGLTGVEFDAAITLNVSESNGKTYTNINVRPLHSEPAA